MTDPATLPPGFPGLVEILSRLRAPDGCPWDREQTHESLLKHLLEESVEVVEAVRAGDPDHLAEELGDVLLQVVFHAQIGAEAGTFTIDDVVRSISEKMVRRHPHVFGTAVAATPDAVSAQWEVIKAAEKAAAGKTKAASVLDRVSRSLPALMRAQELQKRTIATGFAWADAAGALAKVKEEVAEVEHEMVTGDRDRLAEEYGDLLLAVAALGRYLGLDAEQELIHGNAKFEARFRRLEADAGGADGLTALGTAELLRRWEAAKQPSGS
jgi:tetrapyrrole methylase family protein/MazG family protein